MLNRRNMTILVLGALLLALPVVASASTSRVEGMALQGDYLKDYTNIYTYTSQVNNVGNLVYGELGNIEFPPITSDRSVGAVLGNLWEGRLGTWAIHVQEQTPQLGQGTAASGTGAGEQGFDPNANTMESFDVMWGRKFGTTSLGLRLNRSYGRVMSEAGGVTSKFEYDFSMFNPNLSRNVIGVGAGLGFETSPTSNVEFNVLFQNRNWLVDIPGAGGGRAEEDGGSAYQIAGRAMWQWQPDVMVVPVFKYYNFDLGEKFTPTGGSTAAFDNSRKGWQAGVAGNWTLGSNDLFVLGMTVAQNKLKQQEDLFGLGLGDTLELTESYLPQVFAALETHVNSWLTLRFGANKAAVGKIKAETPSSGTDEARGATLDFFGNLQHTFNFSIGAGIKVGNLQLDAVVDDAFIHNGPYFVSGGTSSDMFTKVTATYPW